MLSLIGMSVFLFGSFLLILLVLALSTTQPYNGLNPVYGVYISMIVIGVGFFVMLRGIERGTISVPRTVVPIAVIGLGCLAFIWDYSHWWMFPFPYNVCPSDGICWAELQIPLASMSLADVGAILLPTPFVKKKKREQMNIHQTLPQTVYDRSKDCLPNSLTFFYSLSLSPISTSSSRVGRCPPARGGR